jgi:hypothetical protein
MSSKYELHKNRCSERHVLLTNTNKFCSICYMFRPPWIKFGLGDVHKNLLGYCELRENVSTERHTLLTGVHEFLSVLSTSTVQQAIEHL